MIQGVGPSMPQQPGSNPDPQQLSQWGAAIQKFIDSHPDLKDMDMFLNAQKLIEEYKHGQIPYSNIKDVINDLQKNVFNASGLDVYANSGQGDAQPVQDFLKIFGITPPPVTQNDKLIMKFQQEYFSGLPTGKGADALLTDLHNALMQYGSQDSAGFQKWMQQELGSDTFKNCKNSDAIDFFKSFLSNR